MRLRARRARCGERVGVHAVRAGEGVRPVRAVGDLGGQEVRDGPAAAVARRQHAGAGRVGSDLAQVGGQRVGHLAFGDAVPFVVGASVRVEDAEVAEPFRAVRAPHAHEREGVAARKALRGQRVGRCAVRSVHKGRHLVDHRAAQRVGLGAHVLEAQGGQRMLGVGVFGAVAAVEARFGVAHRAEHRARRGEVVVVGAGVRGEPGVVERKARGGAPRRVAGVARGHGLAAVFDNDGAVRVGRGRCGSGLQGGGLRLGDADEVHRGGHVAHLDGEQAHDGDGRQRGGDRGDRAGWLRHSVLLRRAFDLAFTRPVYGCWRADGWPLPK